MRIWIILLLFALIPLASATIIQDNANNFTITVGNAQIKTYHPFIIGNDYYWELYSSSTPISYWTKVKVERCKKVGANCDWSQTLEELMTSVSSNRVSDTLLYQNYTTDQGSKFNITFRNIGTGIKIDYDINGALASPIEYQVTFESHYIPSQIQNNSAQKKVIIGNGQSLIYDYSGELVYPSNSSLDINGKVYRHWFRTGLGGTVKHIEPVISGGAVGYYNVTCNMNNGSYCNLSAPVNATNITAVISGIVGSNTSVSENIYTPTGYNLLHNGQWVGQTFTANQSGNFVQINISLYKGDGSATKPLNISLYNVSAGKPTGSRLAMHTISTTDWISMESTNSMHLYTLNFTYPLNNSWLYAVAFETTEPDTINDEWRLGSTNTNTAYPNGNSFYSTNQGVGWTTLSYDHPFSILVSQPTVYTAWISEKTNISNSVINSSDGTAMISFTDFLNPVQNFQCFNNISYNGFSCAISVQYSGDTISSSETAINGNYTQIINYIPENYATNVTLTFPINDATFTGATWKGTLAYVTNLSANVTGSGYNTTSLWLNLSDIAANFNFTASVTIPYNNAPTGSISNKSFEAGNSMIVICTANDAESNTLNISMTVNSTLKQGSSCSFDYTGLAVGNYSSQVNITDLNGTIGTQPYPHVNLTFWVNVSADVTAPTTPIISNGTPAQTTLVLLSTNETEYVNYTWWWKENTTSTWLNWTTTSTNTTTVTGITSCSENDYFVQVYDAGGNYANSSQITVQQACENAEYAAIVTKLNTVINNQNNTHYPVTPQTPSFTSIITIISISLIYIYRRNKIWK